jgi:hypothetical protein
MEWKGREGKKTIRKGACRAQKKKRVKPVRFDCSTGPDLQEDRPYPRNQGSKHFIVLCKK